MGSYRKVGNDILKEWLDFREEELGSLTCKEDKEHFIYFEEISEDILNNISGNNIEYVKSQLEKLDDNIMAYMHYCARELASKLIRVNAVHPAMTDTPLIHSGSLTEDDRLRDMEQYPLKRYAKPEEIAYAIIYLLSDASAWTTGTSLIVDGGLSLI